MAKEYLIEVTYRVWIEAEDAKEAETIVAGGMLSGMDLMNIETKDETGEED
jgi:hypothetical protein